MHHVHLATTIGRGRGRGRPWSVQSWALTRDERVYLSSMVICCCRRHVDLPVLLDAPTPLFADSTQTLRCPVRHV